jgi:hypothetical protein
MRPRFGEPEAGGIERRRKRRILFIREECPQRFTGGRGKLSLRRKRRPLFAGRSEAGRCWIGDLPQGQPVYFDHIGTR